MSAPKERVSPPAVASLDFCLHRCTPRDTVPTLTATIVGTDDDDTITPTLPVGGPNTTAGDDVVQALGGNDTVDGGGGADLLDGGDGNDELRADGENDTLIGGAGRDDLAFTRNGVTFSALEGGDGNDRLEVYAADNFAGNRVDGGAGDDFINYRGDAFFDASTIIGGAGDDTVRLKAGDVTVDLGAGDDILRLWFDGDTAATFGDITLGEGRDQVKLSTSTGGGYDLDLVPRILDFTPGAGGDQLNLVTLTAFEQSDQNDSNPFVAGRLSFSVENGEAVLRSGAGAEIRLLGVDPADLTADNITGGYDPNGDFVARDLTGTDRRDWLQGADGDDTLDGGGGNDLVDGLLGGRDSLDGGAGDDTVVGFSDDDVLSGGSGSDAMLGGTGNDTLKGGDGDDVGSFTGQLHDLNLSFSGLDGGIGNDLILGGAGNDLLVGGRGSDTLVGGRGNDTLNGEQADPTLPRGVDRADTFVFSGAPGDGVDTITRFDLIDDDVLDLQGWFGPGGATLLDGNPGGGDDFDAVTGPLTLTSASVLGLDLTLGAAPTADDVAQALATSTVADGVRLAVLVHDAAGGPEGGFSLFFAQERANDGNDTLDADEIRLVATATLLDTARDVNAFSALTSDNFVLGGAPTVAVDSAPADLQALLASLRGGSSLGVAAADLFF